MEPSVKATVCGDIATVMLNRPKVFNAFDLDTMTGVAEHLINLAADDTVRAVVISGEGKAFCAGADLRSVDAWPGGLASAFHNMAARYHQAILEIRRMPKPVIAAINGIAAGGGFSLALACDFRVMAHSAVLRQAYTSNGLSIDGGGTFMLPRLVGLARALEIAAFDKPITADQALKWGLVTKVAKDGQALTVADDMAQGMVQGAISSFAHAKELFTDSFNNSFETHIERERILLCESAANPEGKEGIQAFLEKRKPIFNG